MIALTVTTDEKKLNTFQKSCFDDVDSEWYLNNPNIGVVPAFQILYERNKHKEILAYMHDDLEIHELWVQRVADEFLDPKVAIVGLGGAMGLGVENIYKTRYQLQQLQRIDYYSNQRDWEIHGKQETGSRDVAVVDGFFMAIRTEFLKQIDGWRWFPHEFHCYDTALCCMAHSHGHKVRMVGVDCTHYGGGTSTKAEYVEALRERGRTVEQDHTEPHVFLYEQFRHLLPLRV